MRAALYRSTGKAAEVLRVEEVPRPEPGPGEVLVRVYASGMNPTDYKARSGAVPRPMDDFQIPHHDGAGVIEAVGPAADPGRVGQRVWLWFAAHGRRWGTAAEWTVVPEGQAVPLPDGASFELGASLGVPAMTAHRCLFSDGPVNGQTVLVAGGAGAVGHFAIELAKRAGCRVITTVSSHDKAALAEKAGADLVVNYRSPDAAEQVKEFAPVDRVIEVALGANLGLDLAVVRPHATIVTYAADAADPALPVRACMTANLTLKFVLVYGVSKAALEQAAADITAALAAGELTGLPVRKFPLADIAAAHEAAERGVVGKVIVAP
jgi:NADPH2:quinone reductase